MLVITFIISIIALIISVLAYQRTGGAREMKKTVDSLSSSMESLKERTGDSLREQVDKLTTMTESLRERTADVVDRLEKVLRKEPEQKPPEEETPNEKTPRPKGRRAKTE